MIRFTKAKPIPRKPVQKGSKEAVLSKLRSFLAAAEPEVVEILVSNWNTQVNSVTYKELREAYLAGGIAEKQFQKWQSDYSKLVTSTLAPKWQQAADKAAQEVQAKYPYFLYEPSISASLDFIKQHGAELVTNLSQEQRDALNAIIAHCSGYTAVTPDEAARMMRPCIGLTKPQALANVCYRQSVKDAYLRAHPNGNPKIADKKAADAAARYAGRQHRYRAQSIARTELAYAYNAGAYGATKDAQAKGYIGDCKKVWLTAFDERVCPICSMMDEQKRNMNEPFSNGKMLPPGHPQCRCAVAYEEIPGTNLNPVADILRAPGQSGSTEPTMAEYFGASGTFDIEAAKEDYRRMFLTNVPEENKIKFRLQIAFEDIHFQEKIDPETLFEYTPPTAFGQYDDFIAFNPEHPQFRRQNLYVTLTHELAHQIDFHGVYSWKQNGFINAIQKGMNVFNDHSVFFQHFCREIDKEGFLSDIMSAICRGEYSFPVGHSKDYWQEAGKEYRQFIEIYANLFSLEAFEDRKKLEFLKKYFPNLMREYNNLKPS